MTVCLAAICTDGNDRAVVLAADRMQTIGITEYENATTKMMPITDMATALISGDALRGSQIIRDVQAHIKKNPGPYHVARITEFVVPHTPIEVPPS